MATGDVSVISVVDTPTQVLTLAEAKNFIRVTVDDLDDDLITDQISAAVEIAESYLSRDVLSKTRELYIERVDGDRIELYFPPITSVDSVFVDDTEQVVDEGYQLKGAAEQQYIQLNQDYANEVIINYTTEGLTDSNVVKQGVLSIVRDLYNDGVVSEKYKTILASKKLLYI